MFIKKKKINMLNSSIEALNRILEEGNFIELTYILGNKKEIIKRNLMAGIFRGVGIRYRSYGYYCYTCNSFTENSYIEYSSYWRIYC